jgi:hypothetical protein
MDLDSVNTEVDSPLVKIPAYCEDVGTCRTRRSRPDWSGLGRGGVVSQAYDWAGLGRGVFLNQAYRPFIFLFWAPLPPLILLKRSRPTTAGHAWSQFGCTPG